MDIKPSENKLIECNICLKPINKQISICPNKHTICIHCIIKTDKCPFCECVLNTRIISSIPFIVNSKISVLKYIKINKNIDLFLNYFKNHYYTLADNSFSYLNSSDINILAGAKINTTYIIYKELNTYLDKTTNSYTYTDDYISRWFITSKDAENNSSIYTNNKDNKDNKDNKNISTYTYKYIIKAKVSSDKILIDLDYLFENKQVILLYGKYDVEIYEICDNYFRKINTGIFAFTSENKNIIMNGPLYFSMSELEEYATNCKIYSHQNKFEKELITDKLIDHIDNPVSRCETINSSCMNSCYNQKIPHFFNSKIMDIFLHKCINYNPDSTKILSLLNNYELDILSSTKKDGLYTLYKGYIDSCVNIHYITYKDENISTWVTSKIFASKTSRVFGRDLRTCKCPYTYILEIIVPSNKIIMDLNSFKLQYVILDSGTYNVKLYSSKYGYFKDVTDDIKNKHIERMTELIDDNISYHYKDFNDINFISNYECNGKDYSYEYYNKNHYCKLCGNQTLKYKNYDIAIDTYLNNAGDCTNYNCMTTYYNCHKDKHYGLYHYL